MTRLSLPVYLKCVYRMPIPYAVLKDLLKETYCYYLLLILDV